MNILGLHQSYTFVTLSCFLDHVKSAIRNKNHAFVLPWNYCEDGRIAKVSKEQRYRINQENLSTLLNANFLNKAYKALKIKSIYQNLKIDNAVRLVVSVALFVVVVAMLVSVLEGRSEEKPR